VGEVCEALTFAREHDVPIFILGGGSNILISDEGFDGLVVVPKCTDITFGEGSELGTVTAGAGVVWDDLVIATLERGLAGFECLSGVPGTVGGAVVANLGCYGAQMSDTFVSAEVIDLRDTELRVQVLTKEECAFSYHESLFGREAVAILSCAPRSHSPHGSRE
jgi:UDP-N-acetylmuramate dehydrogenase